MPYETDTVSERYAQALFEVALAQGRLEQVTADVHALRDLYEGVPELRALFRDVTVPRPVRRQVLTLLGEGAEPLTRRFLERVEANSRLPLLTAIADRFTAMVFEHANLIRAVVTSARPFGPEQSTEIRQRLGRRFGKTVIVRHRQDAGLVAGFVVRAGDVVIDCSVKGHLERLKERLLGAEAP
jgi:F-type H+-transporting ATPase subunit delta